MFFPARRTDSILTAIHQQLEKQSQKLEAIRAETINRADAAMLEAQRIRMDLPREYVPRVEHMGRWAQQDKDYAEMRDDIKEIKLKVESMDDRMADNQLARVDDINASANKINDRTLTICISLLVGVAGALINYVLLHGGH